MTAKNPRINVTFEEKIATLLCGLARQEHKSVSRLVRELALEALETREDFYLSKIAAELDVEGAKTYGHHAVWQ